MLIYKAKLLGINVIMTEESYTSKCSFIDNETLCKHDEYCGIRIKRGLFKTSIGLIVNADVNGACNIARKVSGDYSEMTNDHIKGVLANPLRITLV
jgi:transposase